MPCIKCIICPLDAEKEMLETNLAQAAADVAKVPDFCIDAWTSRLKAIDAEKAAIIAANEKG